MLGPVDAPETLYIEQNAEKNGTVHLAAYSYEESRQLMAPYGISYMSDSEDGELEEVRMWGQQNPDINYIGIERYSSVLLRGLQKRAQLELNNIYFMCIDAKNMADYFAPGEVDKIYLNFSDPWPKARHARRRLTSNEFFKLYDKVLTADGTVEFKTDNHPLFDFSVEELKTSELFVLDQLSYNLHNDSKMNQGNIMTEYEAKFSSMGNPICKLIAKRR